MRDDSNRNSYADLVHRQYETMNPLEPMTDIPEDELKNVGTHTSQSLSSEEADHSGFSQNTAGPADAQKDDEGIDPDISALEAWRATGAEPDNRTLGDEVHMNGLDGQNLTRNEGEHGDEAVRAGKLPLDHVPADTSFSLGTDANQTYQRRAPEFDPAFHEEEVTSRNQAAFYEPRLPSRTANSVETPLEDVPDADELQAGSPVDPAVPEGVDQHGTDLLNGVGGVDDEHDRKLPDDM
ncbi:hypothetical protein [Paenibacillus dakarensis]|uniref:hypothetical protein n=1 Tax=Paenibacillus dakarensis TaxID=1527293 RepID=UPI0006D5417F|nr:hypothetical protein [Paenibacillus dakarensis]